MLWSVMLLVGLTGGLASGKSTVARLFQSYGAVVIDADRLARAVVEPGKPAWKEIVRYFGTAVLKQDGTLDRPALARVVFTSPRKLRRLTEIIHPRVARHQAKLARQIAMCNPEAVIIYDAALLLEAGAHRRMDRVIVVKADQETQVARAQQRDGLTRTKALQRLRSQMPLADKYPYADMIIDGTLSLSRLRRVVRNLFLQFQQEAKQHNGKRHAIGPKLPTTRVRSHVAHSTK